MELRCKHCGQYLGKITEGKIATEKIIILCRKCYKAYNKDDYDFEDELERAMRDFR